MLLYVLFILGGVALLGLSADRLVDTSAKLATLLRIAPMIVGVVVMGFGTSLPELLVSVQAALAGFPDAAVGNVAGSNTFNLGIILGVGALIVPLAVRKSVVQREVPVAVAATVAYAVALWLGATGRPWAALATIGIGVGGMAFQLLRPPAAEPDDPFIGEVLAESVIDEGDLAVETKVHTRGRLAAAAVVWLVGLVLGAEVLLRGATGVADAIGLSETAAGVLLLATGTSLPELASVVAAARKGEHELIVGNLWGSTLFNSSLVGGVALLVGPSPAVSMEVLLIPVGVVLVAWAASRTNHRVSRREGTFLLVAGMAAMAALVL